MRQKTTRHILFCFIILALVFGCESETESPAPATDTKDTSNLFEPPSSISADTLETSEVAEDAAVDETQKDGSTSTDEDIAEEEPDTAPTTQPLVDTDGDGILDHVDNCPSIENFDQDDFDEDGDGDACDLDKDGDFVQDGLDCEPLNPSIYPGSYEFCDGADNNCDGNVDEPGAKGCTDYFIDEDGDGIGTTDTEVCLCNPEGTHNALYGGDCDDTDPNTHPWVPERCNDLDENCNGLIDEGCDDDGDGFCDSTMELVGTPAICPNGGGDCLDYSTAVNPGMAEVSANGLDDDCDGKKLGDGGVMAPDCTGMPCTGKTTDAILCGLDLCYPGLDLVQSTSVFSPTGSPTNTAWAVVNHFGSPNNDLAPLGGESYVLLATGPATGTSHSKSLGGSNISDPFANDGFKTYDNMEIKLKMTAPGNVTGFTIDYLFLSVEYEEYIGSNFNDKFYIILKAPVTTNNQKKVINYTACSNPNAYYDFIKDGQKWCYVAINTAFSESCSNVQTDISGTGFQCGPGSFSAGSSTGWLQTSWPIEPGESFEIIFHIHDASDGVWDSEVILDNWVWEAGEFEQGTTSHN